MISAEEARLRAVLAKILVATLGPISCLSGASAVTVAVAMGAGAAGCGTSKDDAPAAGGGSVGAADATVDALGNTPNDAASDGTDAGGDAEPGAASDAGVDAPSDAPSDPCAPYTVDDPEDGGPDAAPDPCAHFFRYACGVPAQYIPRNDCYYGINDCASICPGIVFNCHAVDIACDGGAIPDGQATIVDCTTCPGGVGRRPDGLCAPESECAATDVGAYFARAAHLEAASIGAFRTLRHELRAFGAPRALVKAAASAAADEVRHARATARLARRFGARPARVRTATDPLRERSLEALAHENAVEGCVHETFGALVAAWQAARAEDTEIAAEMATIAADELTHAALGWAIASWASGQLDDEARARVEASRREAIAVLEAEVTAVPTSVIRTAGLPSATDRACLIRNLHEALLS